MKFILLLCCLGLAAARPSRPKTRMLQDLFSPLLHLRQEIAGGGYLRRQTTCGKALSDALGDFLSRIKDIPDLPPWLDDEGNLREISLRSTGLDLFDDAARQGLCCALTQVESVSSLKETLNEVNYHQFKVMYDFIGVLTKEFLARARPEVREDIRTIQSLGLLNLDPEGVAWMIDEPEISDASLAEKCAILQNLAAELIESVEFVYDNVLDWTGINLNTDTATVDRLLCDVLGAAKEDGLRGLRAIYDVIDGYDIIDALIREGYPLGVQSVHDARQAMQQELESIDNLENGPPHGKPPGHRREQVGLLRAMLRLINEVEKEGLLNLEFGSGSGFGSIMS